MVNYIEEIMKAKAEFVSAMGRRSGIAQAKERLMNLLFNYHEDLIGLAEENKRLQEEVEALDVALGEADDEIKKLRQKKKAPAETVEE